MGSILSSSGAFSQPHRERSGRPTVTGLRWFIVMSLVLSLALVGRASDGVQSDAIYAMNLAEVGSADSASQADEPTPTQSSNDTDTSRKPEPILFVFDTSSSMSESGDDGVVRLEGAKAAAIETIYGLPVGTKAGVWAYPDDGGCSAGKEYLDVTELDISRLTAEVQNLQPNGNTPTAAALRAATDYFKEKNFDSGTIVLASDGEANCQDDPCEVAQQIVAEGFDLTVNTAGINISEAGLEQLQCIAKATGGRYYDVTDAQELAESLKATSQPSLRLEVDGHDGTARADSRVTITATVTNESPSIPADGVALSLNFLRSTDVGLALPAIPPVYQLGSIPAGESVTQSWTVSTGEEGIAYPRVLAQPANASYVQVDGELTISARPATLDDAGSLLADAVRIVILGDSYSSGEGAGTGPDAGSYVARGSAEDGCHRSLNTYGLSLYGIDNEDAIIACSGAVTEHYDNGNADRDRKEQRHYLQDLLRDEENRPDAVLLTFGGNDIGFADVVTNCALPTDCTQTTVAVVDNPLSDKDGIEGDVEIPLVCPSLGPAAFGLCESWKDRRLRQAAQVKTQLASTYAKIAQDIARETPSGTEPIPLVVLPYVQIITNTYGQGCSHLSDAERRFGVDLLRTLNLSIEQAVKETQEQGWVVYYARDVTQAVLPGHTACAPQFDDRHINAIDIAGTLNPDDPGALAPCLAVPATGVLPSPLAWSCLTAFASQVKADAQELMHPNTRGYQSITNALVEWSALPAVEQQWRSDQDGPLRADDRWLRVTEALSQPVTLFTGTPQVTLGLGAATNPQTITAGGQITVTAEGFAPGVPVRVQLESSPVTLAAVNATDDGLLSVLVTVPADTPAGEHHLTAEGTGEGGQTVLFRESITVAPATPLWILIVAAAALLAAGAAIVLHMNGRRTR